MSEFEYFEYRYHIPYHSLIIFFIKQNKLTNQILEVFSWNEFRKEKILYSESIPFFVPANSNYKKISEIDYKKYYDK
jgi:hypothetical protein